MVKKIIQIRSEYTSARLILSNLEHRLKEIRFKRLPGYLPPEVDFLVEGKKQMTIKVRDYDVRELNPPESPRAIEHLSLILAARNRNLEAAHCLKTETQQAFDKISARFTGEKLIENEHVVPYTTSGTYSENDISNKGAILLDLSNRGIATADFSLLTASAYSLPPEKHEPMVKTIIQNLEILSGRKLEDPENPLLIAMRTALPEYLPGFMPTYLNIGFVLDMLSGLQKRYGKAGAARIRFNNRKTILENLDPEAFRPFDIPGKPLLSIQQNTELAEQMESEIAARRPDLLKSAWSQLLFFLEKAYDYYYDHLDVLRSFMTRELHRPAIIFQRMVCSVIDRASYAGVIYSRHPRLGTGLFLQFGRTIYGEDLMTGRLQPEERHFQTREQSLQEFPAVYHCWERIFQLEDIFRSPVMVEFTGVKGTFTILQVNPAEMSGAGMITAVIDMHRSGRIPEERVRELIKPYHVRQIESDAIDPKSFHSLTPFCRGLAVLPRSAVVGRIYFSSENSRKAREESGDTNVILAKERFTPMDAIEMQDLDGICSLSPLAIHVVSSAQSLGIPALLNLEGYGARLDHENHLLINSEGYEIQEGSWVTISSAFGALYVGKVRFAPARLLRFMAGEEMNFSTDERIRFEELAKTYSNYRNILENVDAEDFKSLQDLGHAVRFGRLGKDEQKAAEFVNRCFDVRSELIVRRLLDSTLGTHFLNQAAYACLSADRKARLLKAALKICAEKNISGYNAGAFVIGCLVPNEADVFFWKKFTPAETARILNEWVLHQKYINILNNVGEKKIRRAKSYILSSGLGSLWVHKGLLSVFVTLKLSGVPWNEVSRAIRPSFDAQTQEVIDLLRKPYSAFFDFSNPWSLAHLKKLCDTSNLPLPRPDDI
jgi:hypothetical protein